MDSITNSDLLELLAPHKPPCVSIYLPTNPTGREGENDPLRLAQLVDQAQERIAKEGGRAVEARDFVAPLRDLVEDTEFWRHRSQGLAVFFSPDMFRRWRLPVCFDAQVTAGTRFLTRHLLPLLTQDDRFLLLTLSQNQVRLYEGDRYQLSLRDVPGLPSDLQTELNFVAADQGRKQMHAAGADPKRHHATIYHGHGGKPDSRKEEIHEYFRAIDAALHLVLRDERLPLILAGVDYALSIYRDINTYPDLSDRQLEANCDYLSKHELYRQVWPIVRELLADERERQIESFYHSADKSQRVTDVRAICSAAHDGRVDMLWMDQHASVYGNFDPTLGNAEIFPNCGSRGEDLLDLAAANTLLHRGKVYSLDRDEMPNKETVAAVLRY